MLQIKFVAPNNASILMRYQRMLDKGFTKFKLLLRPPVSCHSMANNYLWKGGETGGVILGQLHPSRSLALLLTDERR